LIHAYLYGIINLKFIGINLGNLSAYSLKYKKQLDLSRLHKQLKRKVTWGRQAAKMGNIMFKGVIANVILIKFSNSIHALTEANTQIPNAGFIC
jgi:hypothetical protein